ncbi:MAG: hypothetical protein HY799_10700 [Nitrosomonadales bacterium]|nr:hypothetical protein [Nitrosomonadales bacterium]
MEQQNKESAIFKYLPSSRQLAIHLVAMSSLSGLSGPLIGPLLIQWVNPPQAWGIATGMGDYSPLGVLLWGLAFTMIAAFFYTGWLIALARRGREEAQPKSWYN